MHSPLFSKITNCNMKTFKLLNSVVIISLLLFSTNLFYDFLPKGLSYSIGIIAILSIGLEFIIRYFKYPKNVSKK